MSTPPRPRPVKKTTAGTKSAPRRTRKKPPPTLGAWLRGLAGRALARLRELSPWVSPPRPRTAKPKAASRSVPVAPTRIRSLGGHPLVAGLRHVSNRLGLWAIPQFLEESFRSLWRVRAWSTFAIMIIALSLATVGAFLLVAENLAGLVARMSSLEVSVYLEDSISPAERKAALGSVRSMAEVSAVREVSKEEALRVFREANPELASLPETMGENPLPASFEVTLLPEARTRAGLVAFADAVEALPGVESVSRDLELAERIRATSRVVRLIASFLGGMLLFSALFTVSNVVKLTVYSRRDEVEVLRLVGATGSYVRGLFVTEGVLQGFLGSLMALGLLYAGYRVAGSFLLGSGLPLLASLTTRYLSGGSAALLVGAGIGLGTVGSLLPLRRLARL